MSRPIPINMNSLSNDGLKNAIAAAKGDSSPAKIQAVVTELIKARLILPGVMVPPPFRDPISGEVKPQPGAHIEILPMKNDRDEIYFAVFTDIEEVKKCADKLPIQQLLVKTFDEVAAMVLDKRAKCSGLVVNPMGVSIVFDKENVGKVAAQSAAMKSGGKINLEFGDPKEYPPGMIEALSEVLDEYYGVKAGYIKLMRERPEGSTEEPKTCWMLTIDHCGDKTKIFPAVGEAVKNLCGGLELRIADNDSEVGRMMIEKTKPFFVAEDD